MRNNRTFLVIGVIVLLVLLLVWLLSLMPERYVWSETYNMEKEQPYDLSLFKSVAEASYPEFEVSNYVDEGASFLSRTEATFFYIDDWGILDSAEASHLIDFMERGNTVFVSTCNDHALIQQLFAPCENGETYLTKYIEADSLRPSLKEVQAAPDAAIYYRVIDKTETHPWSYYTAFACGTMDFDTLGSFRTAGEVYPDYLRLKVGQGELHVHATPLIFTNYHFKKPEMYSHVSAILGQLPNKGAMVYYDPKGNLANAMSRPPVGESPLRFILSNPPLKWAWYITLVLALLYVLNSIRRYQRPIPVLPAPPNETAQYLEMLSRLYRQTGKHKHLIAIQEKMLYNHLRNRYRLSGTRDLEAFVRDASIRLQMDESYIRNFVKDINRAKNNSTLTDEELLATNNRIKEFYAQCP